MPVTSGLVPVPRLSELTSKRYASVRSRVNHPYAGKAWLASRSGPATRQFRASAVRPKSIAGIQGAWIDLLDSELSAIVLKCSSTVKR
jgi:hypothetical protein